MSVNNVTQGILAESIFITECLKRDIEIYQPVVDKHGADFVIFDNCFIKIQVKSVSYADMRYPNNPTYKINVRKGKHSRDTYEDGDFDILAAYIIPLDLWYLLPKSSITATTIRINPDSLKDKYNAYKGNFQLIGSKLIHE